ncbi:MAG: translation elongation factor Ts [FCB group bacterium]|jgi:elongation factor Ts
MAQITPQLVKELRDKTGAGMGDCKNALTESNGDMQGAIEILRKKGAASAAKRADRSANEGLVVTKISKDNKSAVIVEVNCETDFVARNAEFERYVNEVADALLKNEAKTLDELMQLKAYSGTILDLHNDMLAKFSEKIGVRRFEKINTSGYLADYIHAGSRLAVLVETSTDTINEKAHGLLRDIAMQIAAMNPSFVDRNEVSTDKIEKEKEIYKELAISEGKKEEIADRIATGKLEKFFQEQCLVEQTFVKDPAKTVLDVIKEISTHTGGDVKIKGFKRYFLGEEL